MSFGTQTIHTEEPRVLNLRVNQSAYGGAKPRVWGSARVPTNMLWYGDFTAIPHTNSQGGGKGGGVTSTSTTYTYTAAFVLALCTGEIHGVGKVWRNKDVTDIATLGLTLKTGQLGQAVWSHLVDHHPDEAVSYSHVAYVSANAFDLGNSPDQPNLSFEVIGERILDGNGTPYDAEGDTLPAYVIQDMVTDPVEGLGQPASIIAALDDYMSWCQAMGLTVSVSATSQVPCRDRIAELMKATLSEAIWSAGQIKFVPYGDEPVGNWSPDTASKFDIGENDLLEQPKPTRTQPADAINRVTVNFNSRQKDYNTETVTRDDISAVTTYGPRPETIDLPCITKPALAAVVCEWWRDRRLYIRNTWEVVVDERFCLVEPMDLGTVSFGPQSLAGQPVRVVEVTDSGNGRITLLVEEWPFGLLKKSNVAPQPIAGYVPEHNIAPGPTNTPAIFEAPNYMTAPNLEIWIGASGGPHWGGANVWVSDDGSSYQQVGTITAPARYGRLTSALAAGDDPDTAHTLYVDMTSSGGQLLSGTQADADNGNTECWLDGEVISYATATLQSAAHYALTYLRRGREGTVSAAHSAGAQLVRLDAAIFSYVVPRERIGSPVWIKLQAVNLYGRSPEPLDTVTPYRHTISGNKPLPLSSLAATGGLFENAISWTLPDQPGIDGIELWGSLTTDRSAAVNLTYQKKSVRTLKHAGLPPGQRWYYWGRVVDTSGNASDWLPDGQFAGVSCAPSSDASSLLTQLQSSIGMDQLAAEIAAPIGDIDWNAQTTEINRLGALALVQAERVHAGAQIQTEQTTRTTNEEAFAQQITSITAALGDAQAAIQQEESARVNADQAEAQARQTLAASLGGSIAAVQETATATATALGQVSAKWGVKAQAVADGRKVLAGIEVLADGGASESVIALLSDKLLVYRPDGTGQPIQVLTLGALNGVEVLGFTGQLVAAGGIFAGDLQASGGTFRGALSAASGIFAGRLAAGVIDTASWAGITQTYSIAGSYAIAAPTTDQYPDIANWTSIRMRATLYGACGGGGGVQYGGAGGGGGYGGSLVVETSTAYAAGQSVGTLVIGHGGAGGLPPSEIGEYTLGATWGGDGEATTFLGYSVPGGAGGMSGSMYDSLYNPRTGVTLPPVVDGNLIMLGGAGGAPGGQPGFINGDIGVGGAGGRTPYTAGGRGAGMNGSGYDNYHYATGEPGSDGYAVIEWYDPAYVVVNSRYSSLVAWLDTHVGTVPDGAR